jgi:cyclin-dependent kinase 12/13
MEQLNLIFDLFGTPTPNDGLHDLPLLRTGKIKIEKPKPSRLREKYMKKISLPCLNLLEKLLELDPAKRLTASRALESRYFKTEPRAPEYPEQLGPLQLGNGDCDVHEFRTKKKQKKVKSIAGAARDEARESGMTEEAAEADFQGRFHDEQMLRVKEEGNSALKNK